MQSISGSESRLRLFEARTLARAAGVWLASATSFAQLSAPLFPGRQFATGSYPVAVRSADLNADGIRDLVVLNTVSDDVSVLLGVGLGEFTAATNFAVGAGPSSWPTAMALGDIDADGKLDLVASNSAYQDVAVLLGDGHGNFGAPAHYSVGREPSSVAIGDLNGDSKLDLVVANKYGHNVSVLLGLGQGVFAPRVNYAAGPRPISIALGDLDGDGALDLAVAKYNTHGISVLFGDGFGGFGAALLLGSGLGPRALAIGDLNRDGMRDIVVVNDYSNDVAVLLGTGAGAFAAAANFPVGFAPFGVALGDLDADGHEDVVVVLANVNGPGNVSVLLGDGLGSLSAARDYEAGPFPSSVAIDDLDGDGKADLAVTNHASEHVTLLRGDGDGSFCDAAEFATHYGARGVALGDFNADGESDVAVVHETLNRISVLLGDGLGSFGAPVDFALSPVNNLQPYAIVTADFNGDGDADLAVSSGAFQNNHISIVLGDGQGNFGVPANFLVGNAPHGLAVGDFNGDGNADLVAGNTYHSFGLSVLLGDGQGGFSNAVEYAPNIGVEWVAVGDIDADGNLDLVTANSYPQSVSVLLGNGLGSFGIPTSYLLTCQPISFALADLDADGDVDLAVADYCSDPGLWVLLNDGLGGFGAASGVGQHRARGVAIADLNGDGHLDLAATNGDVFVVLGDGQGNFGAPLGFAVGAQPWFLQASDLDHDSSVDLIVASFSFGVSVLLNKACPAPMPMSYCSAGTSSQGCVASIGWSGMPSASVSSGFMLAVSRVDGLKTGVIFYGINGAQQSPWCAGGTSFLCVTSPVQRTPAQNSGGSFGACDGVLALDWNAYVATHPTALGVPFSGGDTVNAQGWFRDPQAVKGTNLSDALQFSLAP